jgi:hypothetical protein
MIRLVPLLADLDWLRIAIPVVVVLIYVLNQIFSSGNKARRPQRPVARPPRPQNLPPRPPVAGGAPGGRQQLEDEVGEFLRRAAQQRGGAPVREVEVIRPERPQPRRPAVPTVEVQVVEEPADGQRPVADTGAFEHRAEELSHVDEADEQMDLHLHEVFDHKVGQLKEHRVGTFTPLETSLPDHGTEDRQAPLSTGDLIALLRNPQSLRQVIVLNEILRRPEHRW